MENPTWAVSGNDPEWVEAELRDGVTVAASATAWEVGIWRGRYPFADWFSLADGAASSLTDAKWKALRTADRALTGEDIYQEHLETVVMAEI